MVLVPHTSCGPFPRSSPAANILNSASRIDESFNLEVDTRGDGYENHVWASGGEGLELELPVGVVHLVNHLHQQDDDGTHGHVKQQMKQLK